MQTETALAYLAGIIDGEGSVGYSSKGVGKKVYTIECKMTDREPIDLLVRYFGGTVIERPGLAGHKLQYRWRVRDTTAKITYMRLEPYLLIKRTAP